jgi:CubicO group peptidase (beta-lactamase class C family)
VKDALQQVTPIGSPATDFSATLGYCDDLIAGGAALGGQVAVVQGGSATLDVAFGETLGRPMELRHLHPGFCVTKPLLGVLVGHLLDDGDLHLDQTVRSGLHPGTASGVSLAGLLNHSAGLIEPTAADWRLCPPAKRAELVSSTGPSTGPGYSEVAAGLVLEELIEDSTGSCASDLIGQRVLDPLGLGDSLVVSSTRALESDVREVTTVPFAEVGGSWVPLLSERLPDHVATIRPALGSLVNASGLARFYGALCRVAKGEVVDGLPSQCSLAALLGRPARHEDPVLARECSFSGGFMVGLREHSFGHLVSDDAFGHSAGITQSAAFCDPAGDLAAAFYFNGSVLADTVHAEGMRMRLVDHIVEDVRRAT